MGGGSLGFGGMGGGSQGFGGMGGGSQGFGGMQGGFGGSQGTPGGFGGPRGGRPMAQPRYFQSGVGSFTVHYDTRLRSDVIWLLEGIRRPHLVSVGFVGLGWVFGLGV